MLSREKLKERLLNKLSKNDSQVIVLKGKWGTGKTFLWNEISDKLKSKSKIISGHVSLFGKESLKELNETALISLYTLNSLTHKGKKIITIFNLFKNFHVFINIASTSIEALLLLLNKNDLKGVTICFDDLERMNDKISLKDFFGFVSELSEKNKCNVVIIMNEDIFFAKNDIDGQKNTNTELIQQRKEQYTLFKEKVIDFELNYEPTIEENFDIAYSEAGLSFDENIADELQKLVISLKETNLRVLTKSFISVKEFNDVIDPVKNFNDDYIKTNLLQAAFLISFLYWKFNLKTLSDFLDCGSGSKYYNFAKYMPRYEMIYAYEKRICDYILDSLINGSELSDYKDMIIETANDSKSISLNTRINKKRAEYAFKVGLTTADYEKQLLDILREKNSQRLIYKALGANFIYLTLNEEGGSEAFKNQFKDLCEPSSKVFYTASIKLDEKNLEVIPKHLQDEQLTILEKIYPQFKVTKQEYTNLSYEDIFKFVSNIYLGKFDVSELSLLDSLTPACIYNYLKDRQDFYDKCLYAIKELLNIGDLSEGTTFLNNLYEAFNKLRADGNLKDIDAKLQFVSEFIRNINFIELFDKYKTS